MQDVKQPVRRVQPAVGWVITTKRGVNYCGVCACDCDSNPYWLQTDHAQNDAEVDEEWGDIHLGTVLSIHGDFVRIERALF